MCAASGSLVAKHPGTAGRAVLLIDTFAGKHVVQLQKLDDAIPEVAEGPVEPLRRDVRVVMKNCFAFGGINTSLIFKRWGG